MLKEKYAGEFETHYSAFKGHDLSQTDIPREVIDKLLELGIQDVEQLVAVASVNGTYEALAEELGVSSGDFEQLIAEARQLLPPQVVTMFSETQEANLNMGALEPTPEIMAEIESSITMMPQEMAAVISLPASVNHAKKMSTTRNQGARGTCVAHAVTATHEFYRSESGSPQDYSEQFLYHETKLIDGAPGACGTWQVKAAQVLNNLGQCRESVWSYNPNLPCNNNGTRPSNARNDAAGHKLPTIILSPKDVTAIKSALSGGSVVGFSIPVWNSWYSSAETRRSGRITMRIGNETGPNGQAAGHAMCLIGYQDDSNAPGGGFFILRNSWGTGWGYECPYGAGNGTIPYKYISDQNWEAVTTAPPPPPKPKPIDPTDWWRRWIWPWLQEGEGSGEETRQEKRTIIIDAGGKYDIIIR
jgi:hypothetical protein